MLKKYAVLVAFFMILISLPAQEKPCDLTGEFESLFSSSSTLPFWLVHNRSGVYNNQDSPDFMLSLNGFEELDHLFSSSSSLELGSRLITTYGDEADLHFNELYGKLFMRHFKLEAGLFRDEIQFGGLSTTNGNIARSLDARPYPKIRLATNGYIPFLFWKKWFKFSAEYDEGLLNDSRYVDGTHLHHKSLCTQAQISKSLLLRLGIDHFVMWGGTSPDKKIGKMPEDLGAYLRYITGRSGNSEFPQTDQNNVCGNQYGSYLLQVEKVFPDFSLTFNLSHPFDDHSGMDLANKEDNLYGIFLDFKQKDQVINQLVYEFTYTKKQGQDVPEDEGTRRYLDADDYYNHGVYRSGATYHQYAMVSPLFAPVIIEDGISRGFLNTRFVSHHLGAKGNLSKWMEWKVLLTYTKYFGTWNKPVDPPDDQFSGLLKLFYQKPHFPVDVSLSVATDTGQLYDNRVGIMLNIAKSW